VVAIEIDREIAAAARKNARAAGVAETIGWHAGDFREVDRDRIRELAGASMEDGVVVCNPPYGERLDDDDLASLYRDLYDWCRELRGWRAGFLVANPLFEEVFGRPRVSKPLPNGPLRAQFYLYDL
jgi:23S rRNA G2445 N2-methylase RlmL